MTGLLPPEALAKPRHWKRFRRVALVLLAITAGSLLLWGWEYWTAWREREAAFTLLRARGEAIWLPEVIAERRGQEPAESGVDLLVRAGRASEKIEEESRGGEEEPVWESKFKDEHPESCIDPWVAKRIRGADEVLNLLEVASKRPPGLVTTAYNNNSEAWSYPFVSDIRDTERLLFWVSYDALARAESDRAYQALWLRTAMLEQTRNDPHDSGQLYRLVFVNEISGHAKLCLTYVALTENRFRQIDHQLSLWDDGFDLVPSLRVQRAQYLAALEDGAILMRDFNVSQKFWEQMGEEKDSWKSTWHRFWIDLYTSPIGRPTMLREQARCIQLFETAIKAIDRPNRDWNKLEDALEAFVARSPLSREIGIEEMIGGKSVRRRSNTFVSGIGMLGRIAPNAHRKLVLARLALRLRRYHDRNGKFPATLDDLCDETMPKVRLDWFQNQPLVYRPRADGFLLDVPPTLDPGPGYNLKRKPDDPNTIFAWDFTLKTNKTKGVK